mmetsp:Transcript_9894/g.20122  ORF Transcript_9894/g.20122 Transcript_9894/m.20122 type:complete len:265 (-) Transcript_9894:92-886(-)
MHTSIAHIRTIRSASLPLRTLSTLSPFQCPQTATTTSSQTIPCYRHSLLPNIYPTQSLIHSSLQSPLHSPLQSSMKRTDIAKRLLSTPPPTSTPDDDSTTSILADWRNISLGPSTTSTLASQNSTTSSRGGRKSKRKLLTEVALNSVDISGLQPMSAGTPEEISAMLEEAYSNIPLKTGRRGKRRARRYRRRAFLVQKFHRQKKIWRVNAHNKRMEKRSRIARECREMRAMSHELYPEWNKGKMNDPRVRVERERREREEGMMG